ncbi:hypothetical protein C8J56DRAFT_895192 [Mycena floridula]|nr:hypothetical protein C8J56DRAFT_895192 [Mycena floridula]
MPFALQRVAVSALHRVEAVTQGCDNMRDILRNRDDNDPAVEDLNILTRDKDRGAMRLGLQGKILHMESNEELFISSRTYDMNSALQDPSRSNLRNASLRREKDKKRQHKCNG